MLHSDERLMPALGVEQRVEAGNLLVDFADTAAFHCQSQKRLFFQGVSADDEAREERERLENLLRKLADEIEGDPVKLRVLQELIKIVAARVVADQQTAKSA